MGTVPPDVTPRRMAGREGAVVKKACGMIEKMSAPPSWSRRRRAATVCGTAQSSFTLSAISLTLL
jgi:hypothetical protein